MKKRIIFIMMAICLPLLTITAQNKTPHYLRTGVEQELSDMELYRIPFDSLVLNFRNGLNAVPLSVKPGATAVIELQLGQKLIVCGSNGANILSEPITFHQACPGILIPSSSTLIVFGEGEVVAYGGNASKGTIGENGGSGKTDPDMICGGYGGRGGAGGVGGAPGIGGRGGIGGTNTSRVNPEIVYSPNLTTDYNNDAVPGVSGNNGGDGEDMGTLILLGQVKVTSTAGKDGGWEPAYGLHGGNDSFRAKIIIPLNGFRAGYGGAGGNGASGGRAKYDVGGGAPGAGGGSSGCAGGSDALQTSMLDELYFYTGEGGKGGEAADKNYSLYGRNGEGNGTTGVHSGDGGKAGKYGGNGHIKHSPYSTLNFTYDKTSASIIESTSGLPKSLHWMFLRKITGAVWENGKDCLSLLYGQPIPLEKVQPLAADSEFGNFLGYADQYGKKVYDKDGQLALDTLDYSQNFAYNNIAKTWTIVSHDSVVLNPIWGGSREIYITRYMEDPNLFDSKTGIKRYQNSSLYNYEHFSLPVDYDGKTIEVNIYKDHSGNVAVDKNKFYYTDDPEAETLTVEIPEPGQVVIKQLTFDAVRQTLSWEGLDEELMSQLCTNINDYTQAGNIPAGRAINYPAFRQAQGKVFDHWEVKSADGGYAAFNEELMPERSITIRPVFREALFNVKVKPVDGAMVELNRDSNIAYHSKVKGTIHCNESYRCNEVKAYGAKSMNIVEVEFKDSTFSFTMPDEDVVISADIEYHPFCILKTIKATEDGYGIDSIVYYVTKDWETFYTDNNDYYKFDRYTYGGKISEMSYSIGDDLNIHSDFKDDDGARQPRMFLIKNLGEDDARLEEITMRQNGKDENTVVFFPIKVDSLMTVSDIPLQILWTLPRYPFRIDVNYEGDAEISTITATGRDVSDDLVAFMDEQINFTVETNDSTFDVNNIILEYENGYDLTTLNAGVYSEEYNEDVREYTFTMPESDLCITLVTGEKYNIIAESDEGYVIRAKMAAVAGTRVPCIIEYNTDKCDVPDNQYIYINGGKHEKLVDIYDPKSMVDMANAKQYMWDEVPGKIVRRTATFIMPKEDVYITLGGDNETQGITTTHVSGNADDSNIYNILGQKLLNGKRNSLPKGIYIINGKKQYIIK